MTRPVCLVPDTPHQVPPRTYHVQRTSSNSVTRLDLHKRPKCSCNGQRNSSEHPPTKFYGQQQHNTTAAIPHHSWRNYLPANDASDEQSASTLQHKRVRHYRRPYPCRNPSQSHRLHWASRFFMRLPRRRCNRTRLSYSLCFSAPRTFKLAYIFFSACHLSRRLLTYHKILALPYHRQK